VQWFLQGQLGRHGPASDAVRLLHRRSSFGHYNTFDCGHDIPVCCADLRFGIGR
jgi:hypothetical protein